MCLGDMVGGVFQPCDVLRCRRLAFPPLTDLRAEDVCYENTQCDLPDVRTVQDAIDRLCRERDLRWHNKHLHGWGIVCGLILECGSDDDAPCPGETPAEEGSVDAARMIRLTSGYALDCEGNDLVLMCYMSEDFREGMEAFLNKRKPSWKGK